MKISGFTMVKNAEKLYFPIKEAILSILPIVEEFIVALGKGDDKTEEIIKSINSPKVKIFYREWDERLFVDGEIFRNETNFAMSKCTGDWCFYLQADEVVHEKYLPVVTKFCEKYVDDKNVEGLLFKYKHFWGDYDHFVDSHGWYPKEIRIVRNNADILSYKDAQSFRTKDNRKLKVVEIPAYIFHYGWVRPPQRMKAKKKEQDAMHWGRKKADEMHKGETIKFDYGALGVLPKYKETHPEVMQEWMKDFSWKDELNYGKKAVLERNAFSHEQLKYQTITWFEKNIFFGNQIGGYKNYKIIKKER